MKQATTDAHFANAFGALFKEVGEDPTRPDLVETPQRVIKAMREMLSGYSEDPKKILSRCFYTDSRNLVIVKDIPFNSVCEHHVLTFSGTATVGYLPDQFVVGLSKIPRAVEALSKRLQVQERLTEQIADALMNSETAPRAVAVVLRASHSCACVRGVKAVGSSMITSSLRGEFRTCAELRQEFFSLLGS